ncbi:unnamed protein product, partial [Rotaria magnacalcarata]
MASIANSHSSIVTSVNRHNLGTVMPKIVYVGTYAWRVEDIICGGFASVLSQQINSYYCLDIYFA